MSHRAIKRSIKERARGGRAAGGAANFSQRFAGGGDDFDDRLYSYGGPGDDVEDRRGDASGTEHLPQRAERPAFHKSQMTEDLGANDIKNAAGDSSTTIVLGGANMPLPQFRDGGRVDYFRSIKGRARRK
jgi:hypothetical protein